VKSIFSNTISISAAIGLLKDTIDITFCKNTLRNLVKNLEYSYKRFRFTPAKKPDKALYNGKKQTLEEYEKLSNDGKIDLFYFDESGFSNASNIPYGWSPIGEPLTINSSNHNKRFNVLGFLNKNGKFYYEIAETTVTSDKIIEIFDKFAETLTKQTIVVLDNASIHKSNKIKENIEKWEKKGLILFYLPPYSPQLNAIEILWKFVKYNWVTIEAFKSYENMKNYVTDILYKFKNKDRIITFKNI